MEYESQCALEAQREHEAELANLARFPCVGRPWHPGAVERMVRAASTSARRGRAAPAPPPHKRRAIISASGGVLGSRATRRDARQRQNTITNTDSTDSRRSIHARNCWPVSNRDGPNIASSKVAVERDNYTVRNTQRRNARQTLYVLNPSRTNRARRRIP
jgi:hypothetical protein